ncbi:MAG: flagellar basal body rod C-terminal domain-containing protein, partial [Candidatus Riflemargulisbacteria bacterium]
LPGISDVKVDEKGYIYNLNSEVIAKVKVVDVQNYNKLRTINSVLFYLSLEDGEQVFAAQNFNIRQGSFESSNVDYNKLMVDLADKSLYTANTQAIQTRLKMLDSLNGLVNQN